MEEKEKQSGVNVIIRARISTDAGTREGSAEVMLHEGQSAMTVFDLGEDAPCVFCKIQISPPILIRRQDEYLFWSSPLRQSGAKGDHHEI